MADDPPLSRRRLLGSVATIGSAGVLAGAGSWAYFSDLEYARSTVASGMLDLQVADGGRTVEITDVDPGESGQQTADISNGGSLAGTMRLKLHSLDDSSGSNLADNLHVQIGFDHDGSGTDGDFEDVVADGYVSSLPFGTWQDSNHTLEENGQTNSKSTLVVKWQADNDPSIRGESLSFGITLELEQ